MFSSNLSLSGLALGVIGCVSTPFAYSYYFINRGGQIEQLTTSTPLQQVTQTNTTPSKKEVPTITKNFDLLLVGNEAKDGVFAKLTLRQEGNKRSWSVNETNWLGSKWQNKWLLYSEDETLPYTLADRSWINFNPPCYGAGLGWKNFVVCLSHGKVTSQYKHTWEKNFLKIKLDGWKAIWPRSHGYSVSSMPVSLSQCNRTTVTEKTDKDLVVSIHCKDVTLQKTFKNPENTLNTLSQ